MNDTPRTDHAVTFAISRGMQIAPLAEFCRELERENAELRALLSQTADALESEIESDERKGSWYNHAALSDARKKSNN